MIIELAEHFDAYATREDWAPYRLAIHNLVEGHRCGYHVFLPTRPGIQALIGLGGLGEMHETVLRRILEQHAIWGGLARELAFTAVAVPDEFGGRPRHQNQRKVIPLRHYEDMARCLRTKVLVENSESDGEFIRGLLTAISERRNLGCPFEFDTEMGGGSSLAARYRRCAEVATPMLCIADSDKVHPLDNYGDTAKRLIETLDELGHTVEDPQRVIEGRVLDAHEMENLIPVSILQDIFGDDHSCHATLEHLWRLHRADSERLPKGQDLFLRYFDLKGGLKRSDIRAKPSGRTFLLQMWRTLDEREHRFELQTEPDIVCRGLSHKVLERVIDRFQSGVTFRRKLAKACEISPLWTEIWKLCSELLAFTVCPAPMRL